MYSFRLVSFGARADVRHVLPAAAGGLRRGAGILGAGSAAGTSIHPYLSLRSLSSALAGQVTGISTFVDSWWTAKIVLLIAAVALYALHSRMVFTLGAPITRKVRVRGVGYAAAMLAFYLLSGAVIKVGYGYGHRGELPMDDGDGSESSLRLSRRCRSRRCSGQPFSAMWALSRRRGRS